MSSQNMHRTGSDALLYCSGDFWRLCDWGLTNYAYHSQRRKSLAKQSKDPHYFILEKKWSYKGPPLFIIVFELWFGSSNRWKVAETPFGNTIVVPSGSQSLISTTWTLTECSMHDTMQRKVYIAHIAKDVNTTVNNWHTGCGFCNQWIMTYEISANS